MDTESTHLLSSSRALSSIGLQSPPPIVQLEEPAVRDFQPTLSPHRDGARFLLSQQRLAQRESAPPERTLRHRFSLTRLKDKSASNATFNKHDVATAFDALLSRTPLPSAGIAQAILSHAPDSSLDELWSHFLNPKPDKKFAAIFKKPDSPVAQSSTPQTWLDTVTRVGNLDYIALICQTGSGVAQHTLDRALSIALAADSLDAAELLLSYGASISTCIDLVYTRLQQNGTLLATLLLAAPNGLTEAHCTSYLDRYDPVPHLVLSLCVSHHPKLASAPILLRALEAQNVKTAIILLAYTTTAKDLRGDQELICQHASCIKDSTSRTQVFALLANLGMLPDIAVLREELMRDVELRHLDLVRILTDVGVTLDMEPNNALRWAAVRMDLDLLRLLKTAVFTTSVSSILSFAPAATPERFMLEVLNLFRHRIRAADEALHLLLLHATERRQSLLANELIQCGASAEYNGALAVHSAILNTDFNLLGILLQRKCSPDVLSTVIPTAMALRHRDRRLQAMAALVKRGVRSRALGSPLRLLTSETGDLDVDLIQLLLLAGAPLSGSGDGMNSPISAMVQKGNIPVLRMMCAARPRASISSVLADAVPLAFGMIDKYGHDAASDMIKILLESGATGIPVHQTLQTAVGQSGCLAIVRLLLESRADANYAQGACFVTALKVADWDILEALCAKCPPSKENTPRLFVVAVDPKWYNERALELLLASTSPFITQLDPAYVVERLKGNPNFGTIVSCLVRHGLDVDSCGGAVLLGAIKMRDVSLLSKLLSFETSATTLNKAFIAVTKADPSESRLQMMALLLERARSAEIGQTESLWLFTHAALGGSDVTSRKLAMSTLKIALHHRASVNHDNGSSVELAAVRGSLIVLNLLLSFRPIPATITKACLAVASSASSLDSKEAILLRLIDATPMANMPNLLKESVERHPTQIDLPKLLLARGVTVDTQTLKAALGKASPDLLEVLVGALQDKGATAEGMLEVLVQMEMSSDRKCQICQSLLSKSVSSVEVSQALITVLGSSKFDNLDLPKLLLKHGASVGFRDGESFRLALAGNSIGTFKLLIQYIDNDTAANVAFRLVRRVTLADTHARMDIYRSLLQWNIDQQLAQSALTDHLKERRSDTSIVQLLLQQGADPNRNKAECFVLAAKSKAQSEFRLLSRHAKLETVLQGLLTTFKEEQQVVDWFQLCLEEQGSSERIVDNEGLFQCLRRFPKGVKLLSLLLDHGLSATTTKERSICVGWPPEECTLLLWALFSEPRVDDKVIHELLKRRGQAALPAFSTPRFGVSAAFACLLDKSRTSILKELLLLDRNRVLAYSIPGPSFNILSVYPKQPDEEFCDKLRLPLAAMYLGNLEAFSLLHNGGSASDGMLHNAAFLALPGFIRILLKTHDANAKEEDFGNRIPLALVCDAAPQSWCKFADGDGSNFKERRKEAMQLLAPHTKPGWRYNFKTVLHIALEAGVEVTEAMITALGTAGDPERHSKYTYSDKDGKQYSPHEYVRALLNTDQKTQQALLKCLEKGGFSTPLKPLQPPKPVPKRQAAPRRQPIPRRRQYYSSSSSESSSFRSTPEASDSDSESGTGTSPWTPPSPYTGSSPTGPKQGINRVASPRPYKPPTRPPKRGHAPSPARRPFHTPAIYPGLGYGAPPLRNRPSLLQILQNGSNGSGSGLPPLQSRPSFQGRLNRM